MIHTTTTEHGLIKVSDALHEKLPVGSNLYIDYNGSMRRVKQVRFYPRAAFRVLIETDEGIKRQSVGGQNTLVISFDNLIGANPDSIYPRARHTRLPLPEFPTSSTFPVDPDNLTGLVG
jgi:hypothetical protein